MKDTKRIAVAGYRQVVEDGPELCSSESEAEYSDHWEELTGMYTPDILGPDGKPVRERAKLTTGQANALRAAVRAGGQATVSGKG
jgi:hypothetical protein